MKKLACWNVIGLNFSLRQQEVKNYVREKKIGLIELVEIKVI